MQPRTFTREPMRVTRGLPVLLSSLAAAPARKCVVPCPMLFRLRALSSFFFRPQEDYARLRTPQRRPRFIPRTAALFVIILRADLVNQNFISPPSSIAEQRINNR